jgi:hypothetical protein
MKKVALIAAMLSLASCIPVDDFGEYWDKALIDIRLAGDWKMVAATPDQTREHGYAIGDIMQFVPKDGAYDVTSESERAAGKQPMRAKTITAGAYQFLAISAQKKGLIYRYKVGAQELELCMDLGPNQVEFVKTNYPYAKNLKKNRGEGSYLTIALLDGEVLGILSKIPDLDLYWDCDRKYVRVP